MGFESSRCQDRVCWPLELSLGRLCGVEKIVMTLTAFSGNSPASWPALPRNSSCSYRRTPCTTKKLQSFFFPAFVISHLANNLKLAPKGGPQIQHFLLNFVFHNFVITVLKFPFLIKNGISHPVIQSPLVARGQEHAKRHTEIGTLQMIFRDGMEGDEMIMNAWRHFQSWVFILRNVHVTHRMSSQPTSLSLYYLMVKNWESAQINTTYETRD